MGKELRGGGEVGKLRNGTSYNKGSYKTTDLL